MLLSYLQASLRIPTRSQHIKDCVLSFSSAQQGLKYLLALKSLINIKSEKITAFLFIEKTI